MDTGLLSFRDTDFSGDGSPEGVVFAGPGASYRDLTGGALWQKGTGEHLSTGWAQGTPKAAPAQERASLELIPSSAGAVIYVSKSTTATDTRTGLSAYDPAKPFATLSAAKSVAASEDVINVGSGTFTGINLAGSMNWHFQNTVLTYAGTSGAVWDDGGVALTARITGNLQVTNTFAAQVDIISAFITGHASTVITAEVDSIDFSGADLDSNIASGTAGTLYLRARRLLSQNNVLIPSNAAQYVVSEYIEGVAGGIASNNGSGIQDIQVRAAVQGGGAVAFNCAGSGGQRIDIGHLTGADTAFYADTGHQDIYCDSADVVSLTSNGPSGTQSITIGRVTVSGSTAFNHDAGTSHVTVNEITCSQLFNGGTIGGNFYLQVNNATCSVNGYAIDAHEAGPIHFTGRMKCTHANGIPILAVTGTVRVRNALLLAGASATVSIDAASAANVLVSNSTTNKSVDSDVTNLITGGLLVNSNAA